jgi:hypothetical protein
LDLEARDDTIGLDEEEEEEGGGREGRGRILTVLSKLESELN